MGVTPRYTRKESPQLALSLTWTGPSVIVSVPRHPLFAQCQENTRSSNPKAHCHFYMWRPFSPAQLQFTAWSFWDPHWEDGLKPGLLTLSKSLENRMYTHSLTWKEKSQKGKKNSFYLTNYTAFRACSKQKWKLGKVYLRTESSLFFSSFLSLRLGL